MSAHNSFHTYVKPAQTIVSRDASSRVSYNHRVEYAYAPSGGMPPVTQSQSAQNLSLYQQMCRSEATQRQE